MKNFLASKKNWSDCRTDKVPINVSFWRDNFNLLPLIKTLIFEINLFYKFVLEFKYKKYGKSLFASLFIINRRILWSIDIFFEPILLNYLRIFFSIIKIISLSNLKNNSSLFRHNSVWFQSSKNFRILTIITWIP